MEQVVHGVTETEVEYHLARRFQGRGIATEVARACVEYAFTELGNERVISLFRPENPPSRRVAERNGMTVEKEIEWAGLPHLVCAGRRS
jgi:ribosomal-protein-alanine N-acetyltransferase